MSFVATVAHLSYCWALVIFDESMAIFNDFYFPFTYGTIM